MKTRHRKAARGKQRRKYEASNAEYDVPMGIVDRINAAIAYVGEDGIKADTEYKLNDNNKFAEAA